MLYFESETVLKFYNLEAREKIAQEPGDQTAELYDRSESHKLR